MFDTVLQESGGPMQTTSIGDEPRNHKQVINRKHKLKQQQQTTCVPKPVKLSDLDMLLAAQRNPDNPVRSVLVYEDCYVAFIYTDKQLKDMELFCCKDGIDDSSIFGINTTFKLCDMWLTDTSVRNHRLLSTRSGQRFKNQSLSRFWTY